MGKIIKNVFQILAAYLLVFQTNFASALKRDDNTGLLKSEVEERPLAEAIQSYVIYAMTFLTLVAVLFAIWGGFLMLTAGGEDDKVSKGKKILIQCLLGILVIWISAAIIYWIVGMLVGDAGQNP